MSVSANHAPLVILLKTKEPHDSDGNRELVNAVNFANLVILVSSGQALDELELFLVGF